MLNIQETPAMVADCETDGLIPQLTKVHSLCLKSDTTPNNAYSCYDSTDAPYDSPLGYYEMNLKPGLEYLMEFEGLIVFHNGIGFDMGAIQKVYPWFNISRDKLVDTLLLSRLIWPDLAERDIGLIKKGSLPPKMRGSHSLEAWGYRLGLHKGDYAKDMEAKGLDPWAKWNPAMQEYCEQDVEVTLALWKKIKSKMYSQRAIELEHNFAYVINKQEQFGFKFNKEKAVELYMKLLGKRDEIDKELDGIFKAWYVNTGAFTPKRSNKRSGYLEDTPLTKVKLQEFNPGSRQQIASRLSAKYGWKPKDFTETGQPKIDETILGKLKYPEAKLLGDRFTLDKRIGQIAEGDSAWLKLEINGRIHGRVNTNGAVTGRCTHSTPNMAQVPATGSLYGSDCRGLFTVDEGFDLVGSDASQLELVCLAHYMARWDGGQYARIIETGDKSKGTDIHTTNQKAAGLPTRDNAKTFIYGFLYGGGDAKIGEIVGKGPKVGKQLKTSFLKKTPALQYLKDAIGVAVKQKGSLKGIDGRILHVRAEYSALNTLLQSAGGLLVKQATVNLYNNLTAAGYEWGKDWAMVLHCHDEYQLQVRKEISKKVAEISVESFREAGRQFNWKCEVDAESKIGSNWAETH